MIHARDVSVARDGRRVLSDVSLEVDSGELVAVMGANGSGKTSLLRLLAGLDEPVEGTVDTDGMVGFAPEDPRAAIFARTVAEEVAFFPRNRGLDAEGEAARAMEQLGVEELHDRNPLSLSVGEQRRVSVASVLSGRPAALALDEPTAGLDRAGERQLGELLTALDIAVVYSTHAADFAYRFADRVVVLADGGISRQGPPADVLSDLDLLADAGIRAPGIVTWAKHRGLDRLPAGFDEAVAMARERR